MNWFQRNFRKLIYTAFLIPILTVAVVSISHVTKWYGISNPITWAIYLSVGVEIAALSALAAISARMGKKVYFPFIIVTLIQFIGNIFFSYQYIDINSTTFKDWVDMVDPLVSYLGVESGNLIGHKRFLALFAGGMLPMISLSFLHMLVKFEEEKDSKLEKKSDEFTTENVDIEKLSIEAGKIEAKNLDQYSEVLKIDDEKISRLEKLLSEIQKTKFGEISSEETTTTTTILDISEIPQENFETEIQLETTITIPEIEIQTETTTTTTEYYKIEDDSINPTDTTTTVEESINIPSADENISELISTTTTEKIYSDDSPKIKRLIYQNRNASN